MNFNWSEPRSGHRLQLLDSGDGLNYFISTSNSIQTFKLESCKDIRTLNICSAHLGTLWLADCYSVKTMVIDCPSFIKLSLTFVPDEEDTTDLSNMLENLGQSCPRLSKLHVSSSRLNHSVVLALASANFRYLHMLSLTFGLEITDASMIALASSFNNLQLLDLNQAFPTGDLVLYAMHFLEPSLSFL